MKFQNAQTLFILSFIKFQTFIQPKGASACAMASKSYDWDKKIRANKDQMTEKAICFSTFQSIFESFTANLALLFDNSTKFVE